MANSINDEGESRRALIDLIHSRIAELEKEPDALLLEIEPKAFPFTTFHNQPHGVVTEGNDSRKAKVFRIIAEIQDSKCGPYGDQDYSWSNGLADVSSFIYTS